MKRGQSPRERQFARERRKALFVLGGSAAVIFTLAAMYVSGRSRLVAVDPDTLCPTDPTKGPTAVHAVILDATDEYNPVQRRWIELQFEEVRRSIPQYGQLALYTVTDRAEGSLEPRLVLCNPGDDEGVSALTANPEQLRRRWSVGFDQPLRAVLDSLLNRPTADRSPIMETIQAVALSSAWRDAQTQGRERRLLVFSDLMQHSDILSHYGAATPRFAPFESTVAYRRVRTDLQGVRIELYYAARSDAWSVALQGREHIAFWDDYFSDQGGTVERVRQIDG